MNEQRPSLSSWLRHAFGDDDFSFSRLAGDASFRRYFRIARKGRRLLAVDMPPHKENVKAFVEITQMLEKAGLLVPHIHECSLRHGFLLIDDFGDDLLSTRIADDSADGIYRTAIDDLIRLQSIATDGLPPYDVRLLVEEMQIFTDWYCIRHLGMDIGKRRRARIDAAYHRLAQAAAAQPQVFVHRDYHSRNLICTGTNRIAIIDYQDAVRGPVSYDLVSLLKDCYIKWPRERCRQWIDYYLARAKVEADPGEFVRWFDLMGVQRHLKAAGIFARLHHRDQKDGYLKDIPRTLSYITDLAGELQPNEPALDELQCLIAGLPE